MKLEKQKSPEPPCPLCHLHPAEFLYRADGRDYDQCPNCRLIFVPRNFHLTPEEEKKRYQTHQNDPSDDRYRDFLSRLVNPLLPQLRKGWRGLDYGSGPGPTLCHMLAERGIEVSNFDPFFAPHPQILQRRFDFITCTETAEHFRRPAEDFAKLNQMLRPGGILGIMTEILEKPEIFPQWYYRRDPTHIAFYTRNTLKWIGANFGWKLKFFQNNVSFFYKPCLNPGPKRKSSPNPG